MVKWNRVESLFDVLMHSGARFTVVSQVVGTIPSSSDDHVGFENPHSSACQNYQSVFPVFDGEFPIPLVTGRLFCLPPPRPENVLCLSGKRNVQALQSIYCAHRSALKVV